MNCQKWICVWTLFLLCLSGAFGQQFRDLSIEKPLPDIVRWIDNHHYVLREFTGNLGESRIYTVDARSGEKDTCILDFRALNPQASQSVRTIDGDLCEVKNGTRRWLTRTSEKEEIFRVSPDGRQVAFVRDNDLYTLDIATGTERRYTYDGSEDILNGRASWVYYEEILGRQTKYAAFWWSPDSKHLAFYRFDDTQVPVFPIYNSMGQHGYLEKTHYPKAGDPNPKVKIGVADVETGSVVWADFDSDVDQYFGTPFWRPDGSSLLVQWMPREQNELRLYDVYIGTGVTKSIYQENYPTWIDWIARLTWVGNDFLMVRDGDGWQQIYYYAADGTLKNKLTSGRNWNTEILKVDEKNKWVYYQSNGELSTRTDLYRVRFNAKQQQRLTFGEYSHDNFLISPDGSYVITTYANVNTPARIALIDTKSGKYQVIADSKGPKLDDGNLKWRDMVWLTTKDGFRLPGCISFPKNRKEGEKYPVIFQIYGGPNTPSVKERWLSPRFAGLEDVIRISVDHRGSGHCGKKGMDYMHRNLGKWEMNDYIEWVEWLRKQPYVDSTRIMISGGSYGGYMAAMAVTYGAGYFQYAISEYPFVDWALYDSHYTERYMDRPQDNPEGYRAASVLTYLDRYQSKGESMLYLLHGLMDDNVHVQNTFQLVDSLQKLEKQFRLMVFPNERHGWFVKLKYTAKAKNDFMNECLNLNSHSLKTTE